MRERKVSTEREADRQAERQSGRLREIDRQTERERGGLEREGGGERQRQTDRQRDRDREKLVLECRLGWSGRPCILWPLITPTSERAHEADNYCPDCFVRELSTPSALFSRNDV